MSTDDEVERLLQRTRATRERVNNRMAALGKHQFPSVISQIFIHFIIQKVKRRNRFEAL